MSGGYRNQLRAELTMRSEEYPLEGEPFWNAEERAIGFWNFVNNEIDWLKIPVNGEVMLKIVPKPTNSQAPGAPGQIAVDTDYVYICLQNGLWKRFALEPW